MVRHATLMPLVLGPLLLVGCKEPRPIAAAMQDGQLVFRDVSVSDCNEHHTGVTVERDGAVVWQLRRPTGAEINSDSPPFTTPKGSAAGPDQGNAAKSVRPDASAAANNMQAASNRNCGRRPLRYGEVPHYMVQAVASQPLVPGTYTISHPHLPGTLSAPVASRGRFRIVAAGSGLEVENLPLEN